MLVSRSPYAHPAALAAIGNHFPARTPLSTVAASKVRLRRGLRAAAQVLPLTNADAVTTFLELLLQPVDVAAFCHNI